MEFSEWKKQQQKKSGGSRPNNNGKQNQKSYNTGYGKQNQKPQNMRSDNSSGYVGAPYNFVPFYDKVYEYPKDKITAQNSTDEKLITGEITYEVTAETPIMIDDGTQHFFKDAKGRYAIPGSTMRGLIRNNVQVLGLCGYDDDIDDYALMYRNVAGGVEKKRYNNTLGSKQLRVNDGNKSYSLGVLLNVHAGYVANEGGKYVIYQTSVDSIKKEFEGMNYYVLSERKIVNEYRKYGDKFSFAFFMKNGKSILQHEFKEFKRSERNGRVHYIGEKNNNYKPYYKPISYEVTHEKDITAVGTPGQYKKEGYAVSTGKMNEKKAVYIIPEIDKSKECIPIPEQDVRAFKIDLKKKENTLKQFGGKEYFDLPREGEMRPVFYVWLDGKLYFGFTPRLRLFYDHMLKEGLKQNVKEGGIDYNKALFGYVSSEKSCKTKLSFSDAVLLETADLGEKQSFILAEPKPTSYLDYLKQDENNAVTYNNDNFELHGAKQYWLHKSLVKAEKSDNEKASSTIHPLKEGAKFIGKIRFKNLTEDELGLLLWSVRLNEESQMNVGKAKAYGYGRISVRIHEAKKLDMQKAYKSEGMLELSPFCDIDIDNTIECYKTEMNQYLKKPIDTLPHIQDFFAMKDSRKIPEDNKTRYMKIENEYRNRTKPLPTIKSIVERK